VEFRITPHSGFRASSQPANAIDLLWQRLGASYEDVSFARFGPEIRATWTEDVSVSMERDERVEIGRRAVLRILRDACERAPELELDWFAVGSSH
jgi:hypothetical protein